VPAELAEAAEAAAAGHKMHDPDSRIFWMSAALEYRGQSAATETSLIDM
jgi:hypothetical protein